MARLRLALSPALACAACLDMAAQAQTDKATVYALAGYVDFADAYANAGTKLREQIPAEDHKRPHVLDGRDAAHFAKERLPGAANIEMRQVFAQRARQPNAKAILAYCNASAFTAQVAMALCTDGLEPVRQLYGGFNDWKARSGMEFHALASKRS